MQSVASLSTYELQNILEQNPWFTIARKEYVRRCGAEDREALLSAAAKAGIFMLSRKEFLKELLNPVVQDGEEEQVTAPAQETEPQRQVYIIGGDYFSKEDFKALENSGEAFDIDALRHDPIESTVSSMDSVSATEAKPLSEEEIYTETLATIYAEQGLADRAITIYKKLILLYPEKSAYFADLIESAKTIAETIKQQ